jgi:hypothetical protein
MIKGEDFDKSGPLLDTTSLLASEKAPQYYEYSEGNTWVLIFDVHIVSEACDFTVDLRLVDRAQWCLCNGPKGKYYNIEYQVGITFGPEIIFNLKYKGCELGKAVVKYILR